MCRAYIHRREALHIEGLNRERIDMIRTDVADHSSLSPLLRDCEVEAILNVAKGWAAKDRLTKAQIPFLKIGKSVRYQSADVLDYLDRCRRSSTSDSGPALGRDGKIVATAI